jgi:hypothetical protein
MLQTVQESTYVFLLPILSLAYCNMYASGGVLGCQSAGAHCRTVKTRHPCLQNEVMVNNTQMPL